MKKKNYIYNSFLKSKNNIGSIKTKTNQKNFSYIKFLKKNKYYLNINLTINQFNRLIKFLKNNLKNNKKILIIYNEYEYPFLKYKFKNFNQFIFINNKQILKVLKNNKINFIINLDNIKNSEIFNIIYSLKIPIISYDNISHTLKNKTYPLLGNTKNINSIFFINYLFLKIFKNNYL